VAATLFCLAWRCYRAEKASGVRCACASFKFYLWEPVLQVEGLGSSRADGQGRGGVTAAVHDAQRSDSDGRCKRSRELSFLRYNI
jgi:hypothetical protein